MIKRRCGDKKKHDENYQNDHMTKGKLHHVETASMPMTSKDGWAC